jgi:hypothetical protein
MTSRSRRALRLLILALAMIGAPLQGMADSPPSPKCETTAMASASTHAGTHCCDQLQKACNPQGHGCARSACLQGTGHAPAIHRTFIGMSVLPPSNLTISPPVATLILAPAPEGQWRPPRSA